MPVGRLRAALTMTGTRLLQQRQHMQAEKYLLQALQLARAMQVLSVSLSMSTPVCVCMCVCVCVRKCHCRFASVSLAPSFCLCRWVRVVLSQFVCAHEHTKFPDCMLVASWVLCIPPTRNHIPGPQAAQPSVGDQQHIRRPCRVRLLRAP